MIPTSLFPTSLITSITTSRVACLEKVELCYSQPEDTCGLENGGGGGAIIAPVIFLFFSQFLVGIAVSIFYSIGVTYLDDNINKKTYPIYYG